MQKFGRPIFRFSTFNEWAYHADEFYKKNGVTRESTDCFDSKGRLCTDTAHFHRAIREDAFPMIVCEKK